MRPDDRDLAEEIRGHLALAVKERIERGEDPAAARLAALEEFGYIASVQDSMRRVWFSRWFDAIAALAEDMRIGLRSLRRAKTLAATVIATLALGIGANAAIVSVVRGVLLRPLVNRGEDRLVYIRQSAPGLGRDNTTFSIPEIEDFRKRSTTIAAFGDFSTIDFPIVGLGEPRVVQAGVVGGSYFDVMGLRPVLGRLLNAEDDRPNAAPTVVLTHRFWSTLGRDASLLGKTIRVGSRSATIVGVLEPSIPYPADTEIIANVVTSPHHLDATMVTERTHRMTELFGRLAPGATIDAARAELASIHAGIVGAHPEAYPKSAHVQISVKPLRDQITAPARPILFVLLAAAGVVFIIACSNVANLILARTVRREGELAVRAALGAGRFALRRTLLAESLVLCGAGALLGVALARPLVSLVSRFAAQYSVRALEVTVDATLLWVGTGLAIVAAVLLAYVPRLPSTQAPAGYGLARVSLRITPSTNRRLRAFATTQVAFSFVLLAGAGALVATLVALQRTHTGFDTRHVLAFDVPLPLEAEGGKAIDFFDEVTRRVGELPGVERVSMGNFVPWRDATALLPALSCTAEGFTPANASDPPRARLRMASPGFFATLGIPLVAGRDFTQGDRLGAEPVVIVSQSVAARLFPNGDAINRRFWWTEPLFGKPVPRRIVGVAVDVDDENVVPQRAPAVYHPLAQLPYGGRLFVRAAGNPYALVPAVTRTIREIAPNQPVERAATLEDVRAEVLAPERINAFVVVGFAAAALLIAIVGVAGVLAFGVSARAREFGVRLAIGLSRRRLLASVLAEGAAIVAVGIAAGAAAGYGFAGVVTAYLGAVPMPGAFPVAGAAAVLAGAAVLASLIPAARASRVNVVQALGSE